MEIIITYDKTFKDFTREGKLIFDLEKFIGAALRAGDTIKFETKD